MDTHYHRCGECGMVWGHPDRDWEAEFGTGSAEFKEAHSCPRGCPGRWTEHYNPKKVTRSQLYELGACRSGINAFFEAVEQEDEVLVTKEVVDLMPDYFLEEAASWTYDLIRKGKHEVEFLDKRRGMPHTDGPRCEGCVQRLMLFVRLYNRG